MSRNRDYSYFILVSVEIISIWQQMGFSKSCSHHAVHQQCLVVQSIVNLKNSLRGQLVKCFITLLLNTLIFCVEKNARSKNEAFALQKLHTFFQQKYWHISDISK